MTWFTFWRGHRTGGMAFRAARLLRLGQLTGVRSLHQMTGVRTLGQILE